MKKKFILTIGLLCLFLSVLAQQNTKHFCASGKIAVYENTVALKGTIADSAEAQYDVKYVKLNLAMTNLSTYISGDATTDAVTTAISDAYVFELANNMTVDSVQIDGVTRPATINGNVVKISFAAPLPANTSFRAQVFYHGTGTSSSSFRGIKNSLVSSGIRVTYTQSQPYSAMIWWPCKQDLQDKIDSSDIWITVDSSLKAGSNGILSNVVSMGPRKRYEWKSRYPIDYYLLSATVAPFKDYSRYMHFTNSTDSMLVQDYIYSNTLPRIKMMLDSVPLVINYFSGLFGRYPFWKEKYGHCLATDGMGMEHQTMTTAGNVLDIIGMNFIAHELGHQWFGDHITCATWKDIWLNEGLASYMEYLYREHFSSPAMAQACITQFHVWSMYEVNTITPTGTVYVDDTTNEARIFSGRLTYSKGASVAHMLRFVINNDSVFFTSMRNYMQQYGGKNATTDQFKIAVSQTCGMNLDTFFTQWIYNSGWPVFSGNWNQSGNAVFVKLDQAGAGNWPVFKTPVELLLSGPQGDTTIRVNTDAASTIYTFAWSKPVATITTDPHKWLLSQQLTAFTRDSSLGISTLTPGGFNIYPNPVKNKLYISHQTAGIIRITDIMGRQVLSTMLNAGQTLTELNMTSLVTGTYLYQIVTPQNTVITTGKLIKEENY